MALQKRVQQGLEARVCELAGRHVDTHDRGIPALRAPLRHLADGLFEHPRTDLQDQRGLLGHRNEAPRRHPAQLRTLPAQQGLGLGQAAGAGTVNGLVMQKQLALRHGLALPDQYHRDLATLLLDEVSEAAIAGKLTGPDALAYLAKVDMLTHDHDAHDQARAKLHKAIGWALMGKTSTKDVDAKTIPIGLCRLALTNLQRAMELNPQVGVKKDVERLDRLVAPAPDAPSGQPNATGAAAGDSAQNPLSN